MTQPPSYRPGPPPGWGPPPPGWGAPPPGWGPPRRSRAPLWIGIGSAVVLVAALLVTGFVAPGFFLSEENTAGGTPVTSSSESAPASSAAGEPYAVVIDGFIAKVNAGDADGAMRLVCSGDTVIVRTRLTKVLATGTPQFYSEAAGLDTRSFAEAYLAGTLGGKPLPEEKDSDGITVSQGRIGSNNLGGDWCIDGFRTGIPDIDGD